MKERTPDQRESFSAPSGIGAIFDDDSDSGSDGNATISSGIHAGQIPLANASTVGEIRARYRDRFEIPVDSTAVLDGREVDDNTAVREGQNLRFRHTAGEKGLCTI
ncbi:MAG: hypothetical protein HKN23_07515 [Verrucomicrobiales bacterium]|nr:hypothetical protein [Verrucomicrobiales bacterium]